MSKNARRVIILGTGGGGSSIASDILNTLKAGKLDKYFNLSLYGLDAAKDYKDVLVNAGGKFLHISDSLSGEELFGSGGMQGTNKDIFSKEIPRYLDEMGLKEFDPNTTVIITTSASGGSGNGIAMQVVINLRDRGIPATLLVSGDTTNLQFAKNTLRTIKSLHIYSQKNNISTTAGYYDVADYTGQGTNPLKEVNRAMAAFALFYIVSNSDYLKGIDPSEAYNFAYPEKYKEIKVPHGLLFTNSISGIDGVATVKEKENIITARVIGKEPLDDPSEISLYTREGIIKNEELIAVIDGLVAGNEELKSLLPTVLYVEGGGVKPLTDAINAKIKRLSVVIEEETIDEDDDLLF